MRPGLLEARLRAARPFAARALAMALVATAAAGCLRRAPAVPPAPHYVVGASYQAGGVWFYPREDFHYVATGLAAILPDRRGQTADGEAFDPSALVAAHPTLQLPAIARVTNLDNGLQVQLRVNDRGPGRPGRLIGLSRRVGELLGVAPGAAAPVRVEVDEGMSEAVRDALRGGPTLAVSAAPRGVVTAEALAPPPGVGQSARGPRVAGAQAATIGDPAGAAFVPERLPETVLRVPVAPTELLIRAGTFGRMEYARQVAAQLSGIGAHVAHEREGRSDRYSVVAGPFQGVVAADMALDQALRAGVSDARIVVE